MKKLLAGEVKVELRKTPTNHAQERGTEPLIPKIKQAYAPEMAVAHKSAPKLTTDPRVLAPPIALKDLAALAPVPAGKADPAPLPNAAVRSVAGQQPPARARKRDPLTAPKTSKVQAKTGTN